ncbi:MULTISPECIES: NAD(P)H-quinone oxidoreductase subunit L [Cyanophyceae]|uniref:NAD(P)H-quinone oxidoreductase subunit L n=1 Tax=Pseudocalidococcus azoricus BACA0444 TaxID=2918990 RepID=A0AAE4JWP3_9CYAN|nr:MULTISPECIES: NAD(P)H-quinone oxidoreductase subunit L [Cyanophyceae]AFY61597.1 NADH dehydrogenase transmembrane subunit [Synechococcus sp. PCC 6312]MDS3861236.1 NAD(P)H-quinone oxidoreductase subunit L [Pseudocalidococcus azoricus BACA0444]
MSTIDLAVVATYGGLAGAYLLVLPFLTYLYLQKRWYVASSFERGFMYFLVMFFFPGMIVLAPFLNIRPQPRTLES